MIEIYIDVLIVINMFITFLLLQSSICILKEKSNTKRAIIASLLGGISSLLILVEHINPFIMTCTKLIISALIVLIGFQFKGKFKFAKNFSVFYLVNFIYAGIVFLVWYYISPTGMVYKNSFLYLDISALYLAISMVISYLIIKVFSFMLSKNISIKQTCSVQLQINDLQFELNGLVDTGNSICDAVTSLPVCVCSIKSISSAFRIDTLEYIKTLDIACIEEIKWKYKIRLIPVKTISGQNLIPVFKPTDLKITIENTTYQKPVLIGITNELLQNGEFDILLSKDITAK